MFMLCFHDNAYRTRNSEILLVNAFYVKQLLFFFPLFSTPLRSDVEFRRRVPTPSSDVDCERLT